VLLSASDGDKKATGNDPLLTVIAHGAGYGAGFVAIGTADVAVNVDTPLKVLLDDSASVTSFEGVDFRTSFNNVDTEAYAFSRAPAVGSSIRSINNTTSLHIAAPGRGRRRDSRTATKDTLLHDNDGDPNFHDHLAFDINMTNGPNTFKSDNPKSRRSLAVDNSDNGPNSNPIHPQLDFSSDVVILSGRSPELDIDAGGNITKAVNASVVGVGSTVGSYVDPDHDGSFAVANISNDDPGDVYFAASEHINGSGGTWEFRDTFQQVHIKNDSKLNLQVSDINVVNTTVNPIVDLNNTGSRGLTFAIERTVKPTLVDIESTNADPPSITINGKIENPIGITRIVNLHGNILAGSSRTSADTDPTSLIRTNILDLETPDGSVGQDPGDAFGQTSTNLHRINVDVVDSANVPMATTFITARVSGSDDTIYLGQNQFFTGELVQYTAGTTPLGGLTNGDYYYVIASGDGISIKLASVDNPSAPIDISPTANPTDSHSLTPAQRFTVKAAAGIADPAKGFAYLDVKGRLRDSNTPYSVIIDAVDTAGDANLKLWGSVQDLTVGTVGGVDVRDNPTGTYFNFYTADFATHAARCRRFRVGRVHLDSTYRHPL
jgi:hypothetical protein